VTVDVCPVEELPPGQVRIVYAGVVAVGVYNCGGQLYAIEDRCSHDDGPLAEGEWEPDTCIAICPRHGSRFDITTGIPLTLPAYEPVATFPVRIEDGWVKVDVNLDV
jgi:3-phenylpropionate/trans-cinnamate dioxygenase ferredoxin subunit